MSGVTSGVRHSAPTSILQTIETSAAETARMIAERVAQNLIVETEWIASENLLREEQATDDEGWQITNRAIIDNNIYRNIYEDGGIFMPADDVNELLALFRILNRLSEAGDVRNLRG
jgi:hypothetical protein